MSLNGRRRSKNQITIRLVAVLALFLLSLGGAMAQAEAPLVAITGVESQSFPQVMASVAVTGLEGPVTGLAAADFQVQEEGQAVSPADITLEETDQLSLRLVLAVDVSTPTEQLERVQAAATTLVDSLGPRDRMAIITFAEEVSLGRTFTNNTTELKTALDELAPSGSVTALNKALLEASAMLEPLEGGRRVVIAVTDRADNVRSGATSVEEVVSQARQAEAPLYLVGLGDIAGADTLTEEANSTGGRYFNLAAADDMQATFTTIEQVARQGYYLSFLSSLAADEAGHDFTVGVTYQGATGQDQARFEAMPGQVVVDLPNLEEGEQVGGVVELATQAAAPAPLASVQYLLNDRPLVTLQEPPYTYSWDTTEVDPGPYRLLVQVVDRVGNEGQAGVNLEVVRPLIVQVATAQAEIDSGQEVTVMARIEALDQVARVELWLDDEQLQVAETPPYSFTLDSGAYQAGTHQLRLQAVDVQGREASDSLEMRFLAGKQAPTPWYNSYWLRYLLLGSAWGLAALVVVVVAILGLVVIIRVNNRQWQQLYRLAVANLGNIRTPYRLRAEEAAGVLEFDFALRGASLAAGGQAGTASQAAAPAARTAAPARSAVAAPQPAAQAQAPARSAPSLGGAKEGAAKAQGMGKSALKTTGAVASILNMLGTLLPGSMGSSLKGTSASLRSSQQAATQTARAPNQMTRTAGALQSEVGKVSPGKLPGGGQAAAAAKAGGGQAAAKAGGGGQPAGNGQAPVGVTFPESGSMPTAQPPAGNGYRQAGPGWVHTPPIEPGQMLMIDLRIAAPARLSRSQPYPFQVLSSPVEGEESAPPVVEEGSARVKGVSCLYRLFIDLVFFIVMVVVLLSAAFFVLNLDVLWQLMPGVGTG